MNTKIVYQIDRHGLYVGQAIADESPLEPGVWLIPAGCVTVAPPKALPGKDCQWDGQQWRHVEVPA
ncbi:hypothetical protein [Pseudomonas sp. GTC 16482]|uniref:hypothetical protein n=1 Tax=Pseudomonas sp. GTC 16482 TaxID=1661693 RepID=UPI0007621F8C|nr:hypothetical protein [Pseudomonas sp. GTC 16482]